MPNRESYGLGVTPAERRLIYRILSAEILRLQARQQRVDSQLRIKLVQLREAEAEEAEATE